MVSCFNRKIQPTHTVLQYKQHNDWLYGKEHSIQWRLLTSPCCCLCFWCSINLLNSVTGEKILMKLEALGLLKFQFKTFSNNKEEVMWTFVLWVILLGDNILCDAGSWTNVKMYWVYIVIECEIARWRHCIYLVEFSVTIERDYGK